MRDTKSALLALGVIALVTLVAQGQEEQGPPSGREEVLEEYSKQGERLQAFTDQHWNDAETLLGLAVLYDTYGPPRPPSQTEEGTSRELGDY